MPIGGAIGDIGDPTRIHEGGDRPKPGRGMVLITGWSEYSGANGKAHEVKFEIVAWTDRDSVGKTFTENIFHEDRTGKGFPMRRFICLGLATGLFNAADVEAWKSTGMPETDFSPIVGRPMMVVLVEEADKQDKEKVYLRVGQIGLAMYHIKDPKVKDWPKNQALWNKHAADVGDWLTDLSSGSPTQPAVEENPFAGKV